MGSCQQTQPQQGCFLGRTTTQAVVPQQGFRTWGSPDEVFKNMTRRTTPTKTKESRCKLTANSACTNVVFQCSCSLKGSERISTEYFSELAAWAAGGSTRAGDTRGFTQSAEYAAWRKRRPLHTGPFTLAGGGVAFVRTCMLHCKLNITVGVPVLELQQYV